MATDLERIAKLWDMIGDIKVAMLTTWDGERMRSRPMHTLQQQPGEDLWFFTRLDSAKTDDARHYDKVNLAYADPQENMFVSISGRAVVERDREAIDRFWSPMAAAWFPRGREDPQLAMLRVIPDSAEYWDVTDSTMRYLWEVGRANLTGREPDLGEVAHVDIAGRTGS